MYKVVTVVKNAEWQEGVDDYADGYKLSCTLPPKQDIKTVYAYVQTIKEFTGNTLCDITVCEVRDEKQEWQYGRQVYIYSKYSNQDFFYDRDFYNAVKGE